MSRCGMIALLIGLLIALAALAALAGCEDADFWSAMSGAPGGPSAFALAEAPGAGDAAAATRPARRGDALASPAATQAAATAPGGKLTLAQCVQIALESNPRTAASWRACRAAAAGVGRAKAAYLPSASLAAGASRGREADGGDGNPAARNTFDAAFGVRWVVLDGGSRQAAVQAAEAEALAAGFRHNTALQDVAVAVEEAYYELVAARRLLAVAQETVNQRRWHVAMAEARHRSGLVARSDVLKAQTEKAEADLALVRGENAARIARGRLAGAMGLKVSGPLDVEEPPDALPPHELADVDRLLDEAAGSRPELGAALAEVRAQRAAVRAAEARYWPTVVATGRYGWSDQAFPPSREDWSAGLALEGTLFTAFQRAYELRQAKEDLARALAERQGLLRGVEMEVWTAYWRLIESGQAIDAAGRYLASAEESARVAEGEYKNGTGSMIGLLDAQTARTAARTRLVQARLDWYTALAHLERAVGRSLAGAARVAPASRKAAP